MEKSFQEKILGSNYKIHFNSNVWDCSTSTLYYCGSQELNHNESYTPFSLGNLRSSAPAAKSYCELDIVSRKSGKATILDSISEDPSYASGIKVLDNTASKALKHVVSISENLKQVSSVHLGESIFANFNCESPDIISTTPVEDALLHKNPLHVFNASVKEELSKEEETLKSAENEKQKSAQSVRSSNGKRCHDLKAKHVRKKAYTKVSRRDQNFVTNSQEFQKFLDLTTAKTMYYVTLPNTSAFHALDKTNDTQNKKGKGNNKHIQRNHTLFTNFKQSRTEQLTCKNMEYINLPMLVTRPKSSSSLSKSSVMIDILAYVGRKAFYRRIRNALVVFDAVIDDSVKRKKRRARRESRNDRVKSYLNDDEEDEEITAINYVFPKVKSKRAEFKEDKVNVSYRKGLKRHFIEDLRDDSGSRQFKHDKRRPGLKKNPMDKVNGPHTGRRPFDEGEECKNLVVRMLDVISQKWKNTE